VSGRAFGLSLLTLAALASAVGVVYARHRHRQAFIELTTLENQRDELNIEFGRLQLEQATWAETGRIEQVAREQLGMKFPEAADIVVVKP
jgi:cell division protein FtsL